MNEDDSGQPPKDARHDGGFGLDFISDLFSPDFWDVLSYLVIALFRGVGALLGWLLELSPW